MVMADKELIAWLYKLYNTLIKEEGHYAKAVTTGLAIDRLEELVATNEALVKARREDALELLAAHGQAQDAYEAQLKAEANLAKAMKIIEAIVEDEGYIPKRVESDYLDLYKTLDESP